MTRSLQQAIEQLQGLPVDEQNDAADVIFVYLCSEERQYRLYPLSSIER